MLDSEKRRQTKVKHTKLLVTSRSAWGILDSISIKKIYLTNNQTNKNPNETSKEVVGVKRHV